MVDNNEKLIVDIGEFHYVLHYKGFEDGQVNVHELLAIDYTNLMGELLTWPVAFNKMANLKAQMDDQVRQFEFEMKVLKAKKTESTRVGLAIKAKTGDASAQKITKDNVDNLVFLDPEMIKFNRDYMELLKQQEYIEGLYWSAKDKSEKLNRLSSFIKPEEFSSDILQGTINGVLISKKTKIG